MKPLHPQPFSQGDLEEKAFRVRETILRMATNGGCFIGASLSAVDVIVHLYTRFLNVPSWESADRDYFFLSKGHDVPALYGTFVEIGWLDKARLKNHLSPSDDIYWHPNRKIGGIEFHSGSLGHLLSVAIGVAMDCKMKKKNNKIVVLLGDGELDEGSNWEALLVAKAYALDNLLVIVDRNQFQANVATEELIPLEPLASKFAAFGAAVKSVDGHDFKAIEQALKQIYPTPQSPAVLIAKTVRGKGLPSIEARADRWFCNFTSAEIDGLLQELRNGVKTELASDTLVVR